MEKFDIKKFLEGLFGAVNYAKAISLIIKAAVIFLSIIILWWAAVSVKRFFFPNMAVSQEQAQSITTEQGGVSHVTNYVYNNPAPKDKGLALWGGYDKAKEWNINTGIFILF